MSYKLRKGEDRICDSCQSEDVETDFFPSEFVGINRTFCQYCAESTNAYDTGDIKKVMAQMFHVLEKRLKKKVE